MTVGRGWINAGRDAQLLAVGKSLKRDMAAEFAGAFGVTLNAIIGRHHRLHNPRAKAPPRAKSAAAVAREAEAAEIAERIKRMRGRGRRADCDWGKPLTRSEKRRAVLFYNQENMRLVTIGKVLNINGRLVAGYLCQRPGWPGYLYSDKTKPRKRCRMCKRPVARGCRSFCSDACAKAGHNSYMDDYNRKSERRKCYLARYRKRKSVKAKLCAHNAEWVRWPAVKARRKLLAEARKEAMALGVGISSVLIRWNVSLGMVRT